jgi:hypothetical protein
LPLILEQIPAAQVWPHDPVTCEDGGQNVQDRHPIPVHPMYACFDPEASVGVMSAAFRLLDQIEVIVEL